MMSESKRQKCLILVENRECGRETSIKYGGKRPSLPDNVAHYECEVGHKFHFNYTKNTRQPCDCRN